MIRYHAAWVLPIAGAPMRRGWVAVDGDRVAGVGTGKAAGPGEDVDLGDVAVMPGLVNAHTHLELSHLRGRVPRAASFVTWVRGVLDSRQSPPPPAEIAAGVDAGIAESLACGTAIVGDISNTLVTVAPLGKSRLAAVVFYELIRFRNIDPHGVVDEACRAMVAAGPTGGVRVSLAAHAPYSVAPGLFRAIREALDRGDRGPCSVHLAESAEEVQFIRTGGGPWRSLLESLGSWDPEWQPPGGTPVEFLDDCRFLDRSLLAVHGVHMTRGDLERLAAHGVTLVSCPRSNEYTGAGRPPVDDFFASGVRVAVGTDSLASSPDLNVFAELAALRRLAPAVPARRLIDSATREGARALGFADELGAIEPGKSARLIAVDVPADVEDVEEYLVHGIEPSQIRWLNSEI